MSIFAKSSYPLGARLTSTQAARALRLAPVTVRKLADSGQLGHYLIPTGVKKPHRRFVWRDLVEFAEKNHIPIE